VIRCPEAATAIADGDEVTVDVERGLVHAGGRSFEGEAPSALAVRIARAGSLVELIRTEGWAAVEEVTA
jgi:predicted transcriptional regulator